MKSSTRFVLVVVVVAFLVLSLTGCPWLIELFFGGSGGDGGGSGSPYTPPDPTPPPGSSDWVYVTIENNSPSHPPGAAIDAVELRKGSQSYYFSQIHVPTEPVGTVLNNVLGAPANQCLGRPRSEWNEDTFVYLGDLLDVSDYLIGSFGLIVPIETGDSLTIHVCSDHEGGVWSALVGKNLYPADDDAHVRVITFGVATMTVTVPNLPTP